MPTPQQQEEAVNKLIEKYKRQQKMGEAVKKAAKALRLEREREG